ncbi:hypothetical protein M3M35_07170 [Fructilactobacillus myrtifloralis]|uniref:Uncharacterized protein n=1 Tax=Fructilactobacillus myrtifloralis TaxID=2940301 RepID=A0ABY5BN15_9LACO|nr:hypothetical protein [Fructilactobacillus myrtifloralis]USS85062.1 hypothetical protein M3M35_07170 [Fructilactobacillus myrtifloralis]
MAKKHETNRQWLERHHCVLAKLEEPCIILGEHLEKGDYVVLSSSVTIYEAKRHHAYAGVSSIHGYLKNDDVDKPSRY